MAAGENGIYRGQKGTHGLLYHAPTFFHTAGLFPPRTSNTAADDAIASLTISRCRRSSLPSFAEPPNLSSLLEHRNPISPGSRGALSSVRVIFYIAPRSIRGKPNWSLNSPARPPNPAIEANGIRWRGTGVGFGGGRPTPDHVVERSFRYRLVPTSCTVLGLFVRCI